MMINNANNIKMLTPVSIGRWGNYQSFVSKDQIDLQKQNFIYTSLSDGISEICFVYTDYAYKLEKEIERMSEEIKIEDTETILENEVYYTTKIEGAKTTKKRTQEIHNGSKIKENDFSEQMVKNSFDATKFMNLHTGKMTQDILLKIWAILTCNACDNHDIKGNAQYPYRSGDVFIGGHEGVSYKDVEKQMERWIAFYNNKELDNYPYIKAILLHFSFEAIHPFCDGNGRMGRLLMNNYLISRGIDICKAVSFSMQIDKRRNHYDAAFIDAENLYHDVTPFIEYMLEIIYSSYETALEIQKENLKEID